jgi:ubiquinone/menaquinone biosynthesis C-methylase UbiE
LTEEIVQGFYEEEAEAYDETRFRSSHGAYVDRVQKSLVLELIGNIMGKNILEIGAGTGRFTVELVKRGANVVCVDLSRNMHCKSRQSTQNDSVDYFVMSGLNLGFADGSFDGCLAVNTMSHIKDCSTFLGEVGRTLKRNGFFVANFPNMTGIYFPVGCLVSFLERSLQAPVYSRWYSTRTIFYSIRYAGLYPVRAVGHMVFPKKYCPSILFRGLKGIDFRLSHSAFWSISGDLFVKSQKL